MQLTTNILSRWRYFQKILISLLTSQRCLNEVVSAQRIRWIIFDCRQSLSFFWITWWRHQMETFSALPALCAENSPVTGEFPTQRPVARSFDVFFDLRLNKQLSKQSWGWWFETPSRPLWRQYNDISLSNGFTGRDVLSAPYTIPFLEKCQRHT